MTQLMEIKAIRIGERARGDLGDIGALAESLDRVGLLHPPVVTSEGELVCGLRRLEAAKRLRWAEIEVRVIDPESLLLAERDENEVRKDFTPSERVAIGKAIERAIGRRKPGPKPDPGPGEELVNRGEPIPVGKKTVDLAAEKAGFNSRQSYRQATRVVEDGVPELKDAMDSGSVSISAAAIVAEMPPAEQREVVARGPEAVKAKAIEIRGKSRVNGTLVDDPPDIAEARAAGRIAPEVIPDVTEPDGEAEEPAPAAAREPGDDEPRTDEEWLEELPARRDLGETARMRFDRDALAYRSMEAARKAFATAVRSTLKAADRSGSLPSYLYRVRSFLKIEHPKHWKVCVKPEDGGCAGTGELPMGMGRCPKCHGDGYLIH
jgi:hypothetical protein